MVPADQPDAPARGRWDIRDIQEFLGHADISTTALDTQVTANRLVDAAKRLHLGVIDRDSAAYLFACPVSDYGAREDL